MIRRPPIATRTDTLLLFTTLFRSPDECRVVSRAPLTLPPDYNLRPPEPGAPRPQVGTPSQQAERAVFANSQNPAVQQQVSAPRTAGEQALLAAAGAESADPNIRYIVDRETKQINAASEHFVDALVFWNDQAPVGNIVRSEARSVGTAWGRTCR